jgi:hypothetical protein
VQEAFFRIFVSKALEHCPPGYLFVCPAKDLQIGPSSFRLADCPAYWSLDPSGAERLGPEEATELGFPCIQLYKYIDADYWEAEVYAALRQFHQAKGFDPDSQDVARHLGYPLYRVSSAMDPLFAHGKSSSNDSFRFSTADVVQVHDADFDSQEDNEDPVKIDADGENRGKWHQLGS